MEVGQNGHRGALLDRGVGGSMEESGLVKGEALVELRATLHVLHHLDGAEEHAGAVVTDHALCKAVGGLGGGGSADLEPGDPHDVGVEGLGVLGSEGLGGGRSSGSDDGDGHVKLSAGSGVSVAAGGDFGHAVDAEVGVHELDDGPVAVHALAQRLADEVTLVNDLVGRPQLTERLLSQLGDVVGGAGLKVLSLDGGVRVPKHLLEDRKVQRVSDGDLTSLGLLTQLGDVGLAVAQCLGVKDPLVDLISSSRGRALVVVGGGGIGKLELLGEGGRGSRRLVGEVDRVLASGRGLSLELLQLLLGELARREHLVLEDLDGVSSVPRPLLLVLAASLVLGVSRRVSVEPEGVDLKDSRAALPHIVHYRTPGLENAHHVLPVDLDPGNTVVLSLEENVLVLGHISCERVDGSAVVDDDEEEG
mmetsp:Transcript_1390/g.4256  ORF Transcript_1390/g.4256 Transcript_1390/m.4256 type:complete len:419 (-) Transcript_1390:876-2132(-)